jgi:hypothetical protein
VSTPSLSGPAPIPPVGALAPARRGPGAGAPVPTDPVGEVDDAVSIDTIPSAPPAEVLAAVDRGLAAAASLARQGLHVSFRSAAGSGRLALTLQDDHGTELSALTPSQVLGLADGTPPDMTRKSTDVHQPD